MQPPSAIGDLPPSPRPGGEVALASGGGQGPLVLANRAPLPPNPICDPEQVHHHRPRPLDDLKAHAHRLKSQLALATASLPKNADLEKDFVPCYSSKWTFLYYVPAKEIAQTNGFKTYETTRDSHGKSMRYRAKLCEFYENGTTGCREKNNCRFLHVKPECLQGLFEFAPHYNPFKSKEWLQQKQRQQQQPQQQQQQPHQTEQQIIDSASITDGYGRMSGFDETLAERLVSVEMLRSPNAATSVKVEDLFVTVGAIDWLIKMKESDAVKPPKLTHCEAFQGKHAMCPFGQLCRYTHTATGVSDDTNGASTPDEVDGHRAQSDVQVPSDPAAAPPNQVAQQAIGPASNGPIFAPSSPLQLHQQQPQFPQLMHLHYPQQVQYPQHVPYQQHLQFAQLQHPPYPVLQLHHPLVAGISHQAARDSPPVQPQPQPVQVHLMQQPQPHAVQYHHAVQQPGQGVYPVFPTMYPAAVFQHQHAPHVQVQAPSSPTASTSPQHHFQQFNHYQQQQRRP